MRKNELNSLDELKSQYVGVWGPSDNHWLGLDFSYRGIEYRLHTGAMYGDNESVDPDGVLRQFGLYRKTEKKNQNTRKYFFMSSSTKSVVLMSFLTAQLSTVSLLAKS